MQAFFLLLTLLIIPFSLFASYAMLANNTRWLPQLDDCATLNPYWTACKNRHPDSTIPFTYIKGYLLAGRSDVWERCPGFLFKSRKPLLGF
jgi:hypothetical protein